MAQAISRRQLVAGGIMGAVAAAATAGAAGAAAPTQALAESDGIVINPNADSTGVVTINNDQNTGYQAIFDVLVIGAGGAGLTAALQAAQDGVSVGVIEAAPNYFGSDTSLSDGQVWGYNSSVQKNAGIEEESEENALAYLDAVGQGYQNDDLMKVLFEQSADLIDWLEDAGVEFDPDGMNFSGPEEDYADDATPIEHGHLTMQRSGRALTDPVYQASVDAGVEFIFNTRAQGLITDPDGRAVGVSTDKGYFRANKGIVIATSGFSKNQSLVDAFVPELRGASSGIHSQGDGLTMGLSVGAAIDNMWLVAPKNSVVETAQGIFLNCPLVNWRLEEFEVGTDAKRHYDEGKFYGTKVDEIEALPDHFVWEITCQAGIDHWRDLGATPHLSDNCELEIAAGWVYSADTIEELAEQIDLDPTTLADTLNHYNEMAANGTDEDFGRTYNFTAIDEPPYYAIKVTPGGSETAGGLVIDGQAEVLNWQGDVIPGLYAGGSVTGGWAGKVYPGSGVAITNALLFGRIAGAQAAAQDGSAYEGTLADDAGAYKDVEQKTYDLADNEYVGIGSGMGGDVAVKITVEDGKMTAVEVVDNSETPGVGSKAVDALPDEILAAQTYDVDDIAGATVSSNAIKTAVEDAMKQAGLIK